MSSTEDSKKQKFIAGCDDVEALTKLLFPPLLKATQYCNKLPAPGDDHDFYASYSQYQQFVQDTQERLLSINGDIIRHLGLDCKWPINPNVGDIEDRCDSVIEANDIVFEKVDLLLDEAEGIKRSNQPVLPAKPQQCYSAVASWNTKRDLVRAKASNFRFLHAKNIQRPQLKFKDKIDNSDTPFVPRLKYKPNALRELPAILLDEGKTVNNSLLSASTKGSRETLMKFDEESNVRIEHPYEYELHCFQPMDWQLLSRDPQTYPELESTPLYLIANTEQLKELLETLKNVSAFAVDLEAHSYRSYQGFVCLMQLSTRDADYIIDTLELRSEIWILNEVFSNPKILKVMHGADNDIVWLQRDFAIYVVNMFDTGQAARYLQFPRFSLSFLLSKYCHVSANKQLQLADWRIRPLPQEMVEYARGDTHYLLYIFDIMTNDLIKTSISKDLLQSVYNKGMKICLQLYQKPVFFKNMYNKLLHKHKGHLNQQQNYALAQLHCWRDKVARDNDESINFVLPNHMLLKIVENLPRDMQGILACCNPIPTLVRQFIGDIHQIIKSSRERSENDDIVEAMDSEVALAAHVAIEPEAVSLNPTFDEDGLQEGKMEIEVAGPPVRKATPALEQFDWSYEIAHKSQKKKVAAILNSMENPLEEFYIFKSDRPVFIKRRQAANSTSANVIRISDRHYSQVKSSTNGQLQSSSSAVDKVTSPIEESNLQVRQQDSDKRKSIPDSALDETVPLRKKKRKVKKSKVSLEDHDSSFTPYDYSNIADNIFAKDESQDNVAQSSKMSTSSNVFDPYKVNNNPKYLSRPIPRSRVNSKFGRRSKTFNKGQIQSNTQEIWPKQR